MTPSARPPCRTRDPRLLEVALLVAVLQLACGPSPEDHAAALRSILEAERRAHLETDAALLAANLADTLVSVDEGLVTRTARENVERRFAAYFEGAEYRTWDDVEPPVIQVSADGRMAWVSRRVAVERVEPDAGAPATQFESAWTATYEKRDGRWVMTSVASTFAPSREAARILATARRNLAHVGADSAFEAIRSRADVTVTGSDPGSYGVNVVSATEGRVRLEFSFGMTGVLGGGRDLVRGTAGAEPTVASPAMRSFVQGHEVHWNILRPDTRFAPLRFTGLTRFAGRPALRLTGTDAAGGAIDLFYAVSDTLPLGYEVSDHIGGPVDRVQLVVDEWTDGPGPRFPAVAMFLQGTDRFRYRFVEIEPLGTVSDSLFRLP